MRHIFSKYGGNMAEAGSVSWMFSKKGSIVVDKSATTEDKLMEIALEAGADDIQEDSSNWEILTSPENFEAVTSSLGANNIASISSEIAMVPQTWIKLTGKDAQQILKLVEALEDHDDSQHVWANFDIEEEELVQLAG